MRRQSFKNGIFVSNACQFEANHFAYFLRFYAALAEAKNVAKINTTVVQKK